MEVKYEITATIVLYQEDIEVLKRTVNCFLKSTLSKKLFLVDNTTDKRFKDIFNHKEIEYYATGKNLGFGAGHNLILEQIKDSSNYHLILNPDVYFKTEIIPILIKQLNSDETVAMIAPKVSYPNGTHQYSCRRYPSVIELIARKFLLLEFFLKPLIFKGTYRDLNLQEPFFAEYITGCFHLYKTKDFQSINGFDERYFLYMEDVDICKKIDAIGKKKLYYPKVEIEHILKRGSSKNFHLLILHISSAIKYFFKWGFSKNNTGS